MRTIGFGFVVGLTLTCAGVAVLLDVVFAFHLPLLRIAAAIVLIALGVRVLVHRRHREARGPESGEAVLSERRFVPEGTLRADTRFDVVFGRGVIDLRHVDPPEEDVTVVVDAVFGSAVVKVDPAIAYDVKTSSAFGEVRLPPHRAAPATRPHLHLELNAVFGACEVIEARA